MGKSYLLLILAVFSAWFGAYPRAWATVDNTTCTVLNGDDTVESFNSLRRKVERGWKQTEQDGVRFCTQLIRCSLVDTNTITLESPLDFANATATDCQPGTGKPAVCGDGWALIVDGGSTPVDINVTKVATDVCAISLHGNHIKMTHINIVATRAQVNNKHVLCDDGAHNDIGDVTINGERPHPSPTPRPTPHPTPRPTPMPTPHPTPIPTPTPVPTVTPQPTATPIPTSTAEPTPTAVPSPVPTPEPSHTPTPSESPGPKTSPIPVNPGNDNGGPSVGAGGCDGGGWGCTVAQADTWFQSYSIYLMSVISLVTFGILKRVRRRIRNFPLQ